MTNERRLKIDLNYTSRMPDGHSPKFLQLMLLKIQGRNSYTKKRAMIKKKRFVYFYLNSAGRLVKTELVVLGRNLPNGTNLVLLFKLLLLTEFQALINKHAKFHPLFLIITKVVTDAKNK